MNYQPPKFYFSSHLETILPAILRQVNDVNYKRERINTPDNDFLDLDWLQKGNDKLVIISHGLEGSSTRPYIKGMARAFDQEGFDVLAWNFRGCSSEINHQLRFYHSGATDDLDFIVSHAIEKGYKDITLIGFSLGGNLTLKYLGEKSNEISPYITKGIAFSVPLDLASSCSKISENSNKIYAVRFLRNLKTKIRLKAAAMPGKLSIEDLDKIKTLQEFDERYTAPLHGFKNATHYYNSCSSINFLADIKVPTLIVNAKNDPFLSEECYPITELDNHPYIIFETPEKGGHVGFTEFNKEKRFWSEKRALSFVNP